MKRLLIAIGLSLATAAQAQSLDDLNIQIHGYATQGFLYSDHNSWNTTGSSTGSAAWSDVVVNLSSQPQPRLRIGIQARYFLLGDLGNSITLDWAQADFKANDYFGIRVGKVKTPTGLLNESQDIDPSQLWILLPQSVYPIASRNTMLAHYGGLLYGTVPVGEKLGKLQYRGFVGQRILSADDGYFEPLRALGITLPNGVTGHTFGGALKWNPPVSGLQFGFTENSGALSGAVVAGPYSGNIDVTQYRQLFYFARYERGKWMIAGESSRLLASLNMRFTGLPTTVFRSDERPWYAMASYKLTSRLTGGLYFSSIFDHQAALSPSRYQKDWALTGRYDFTPFLYVKAEQHWMDGTAVGNGITNSSTPQPNMRLSLAKLGVSF